MLPELNNYQDLLNKLEYDQRRLKETNHIYELLDCILTLNAIPEWILKDSEENLTLKKITEEKIKVMKGINFDFNENLLEDDIDSQIRLIRLISNHAKHKTNSGSIPKIETIYDATFPLILPVIFRFNITIGEKSVDAEFIIKQVSNFWKNLISKSTNQ